MSDIIKVRINADGVTAREVNPEGKEPKIKNYQAIDAGCIMVTNQRLFQADRKSWREAESKLRTFEIDCSNVGWILSGKCKPRTVHSAEILDNDKLTIRIL